MSIREFIKKAGQHYLQNPARDEEEGSYEIDFNLRDGKVYITWGVGRVCELDLSLRRRFVEKVFAYYCAGYPGSLEQHLQEISRNCLLTVRFEPWNEDVLLEGVHLDQLEGLEPRYCVTPRYYSIRVLIRWEENELPKLS